MSTGNIPEIRHYMGYFDHANISLKMSDHYFEYESVPLDLYSYKYVMIDTYFINRFDLRQEYKNDLARKITALNKLNFIPIFANLWESRNTWARHGEPIFANLWERRNFTNAKTATLELFQHVLKESNASRYGDLHGSRSFFWWLMYEKYIKRGPIDYLKIDHSIKSYDFLYLNKRPRAHRIHLYNQMLAVGALKKSLYTYRNDHHCHGGQEMRMEKINKSLPPEYEIPEFKDAYPQYGHDQEIYALPYNHSRINLVTETLADDPNRGGYPYFLTEKIWKPIICQQPFIVYGQRGYLKCLREMGFRTFSNVWDESYDDEKDCLKRGSMIACLARSLLDMDSEKLYLETKDIRSHNLKIFSDKQILKSIITQDIVNSLFKDLIKI